MNKTINPFELKFQSSLPGLRANTGGKIDGALVGRACGAERTGGESDNLWGIDGQSFRSHFVNGGKSTFTLNPATEPPRLIVALTKDKPEGDKPLRYWLYGLTLGACTQAGRPAKSKSAPGRLTISVGQIPDRIELGYADVPAQYAMITTVPDRDAALGRIDQMTAEELSTIMGATTREKIRAFVLAGREAAPATGPTLSPGVEAVAPEVEREPAESELAHAAESGSEMVQATETVSAEPVSEKVPTADQTLGESEDAPAVDQEPVESAIDGDADGSTNESAA